MAYSGGIGSSRIRFDVIGEAWQIFAANMANWIVALLAFAVLIAAVYFVCMLLLVPVLFAGAAINTANPMGMFTGGGLFMSMVFGLLMAVLMAIVYGILGAGLYKMAIGEVRGTKAQISDLFSATDVAGPMVVAALLIQVGTMIGSWLCVIPGLLFAGLTMLTYPLVVDQKMAPVAAIQASINTLKAEWLMAALLFLVLTIVAGLGAIACGIGVVFTLPLLFLSTALVYKDFFPERFGGMGVPETPAPPPPDVSGPAGTPPPPHP